MGLRSKPKWERLVRAVFPPKGAFSQPHHGEASSPPSSSSSQLEKQSSSSPSTPQQQQQDEKLQIHEETHAGEPDPQLQAGPLEQLVQFVQMAPQKMQDIGKFVEKKIQKQISKRQFLQAGLSLQLFGQILDSTHGKTLSFYAGPVANSITRCLSVKWPENTLQNGALSVRLLKRLAVDTYTTYARVRFESQLPEAAADPSELIARLVDMASFPCLPPPVSLKKEGTDGKDGGAAAAERRSSLRVRLHGLRGLHAFITTVDDLDLFTAQYVDTATVDVNSSDSVIGVLLRDALEAERIVRSFPPEDYARSIAFASIAEPSSEPESSSPAKNKKQKRTSTSPQQRDTEASLVVEVFSSACECLAGLARTSSAITVETLLNTVFTALATPCAGGPVLRTNQTLVLHLLRSVCVKPTHGQLVVSLLLRRLLDVMKISTKKASKSRRRDDFARVDDFIRILRMFIASVTQDAEDAEDHLTKWQSFGGNIGPAIDVLVPLVKVFEVYSDVSEVVEEIISCVSALGGHIMRMRCGGNAPETPEVMMYMCGRIAIAVDEVDRVLNTHEEYETKPSKKLDDTAKTTSQQIDQPVNVLSGLLKCAVELTQVEWDDSFGLSTDYLNTNAVSETLSGHTAAAGAALAGTAQVLHARSLRPILRAATVRNFAGVRVLAQKCLQNMILLVQDSTVQRGSESLPDGARDVNSIHANVGLELATVITRDGRSREIRNACVAGMLIPSKWQDTDAVIEAGNTMLRLLGACRAREISSALPALFHILENDKELAPEHRIAVHAVVHAYLTSVGHLYGIDALIDYTNEVLGNVQRLAGVWLDTGSLSLRAGVARAVSSKRENQPSSAAKEESVQLDRRAVAEHLLTCPAFCEEFRSYLGAASQVAQDQPSPVDPLAPSEATNVSQDAGPEPSVLDEIDEAATTLAGSIHSARDVEHKRLLSTLLLRSYSPLPSSVSLERPVFYKTESHAIPLLDKLDKASDSLVDLFADKSSYAESDSELESSSGGLSESEQQDELVLPSAAAFAALLRPSALERDLFREEISPARHDHRNVMDARQAYMQLAAESASRSSDVNTVLQDVLAVTSAGFHMGVH